MKLVIKGRCCVSEETRHRNIALSKDYPSPKGEGRLAVVGGGTSLLKSVDQLKDWPGDIWAINGTALFLEQHGCRNVYFYSVCPQEVLIKCWGPEIKRAVLAYHVDPKLFEAMRGKPVYCFNALGGPGPTSAVAATLAALNAGYSGMTFFGCESSYEGQSHAYRDDFIPDIIKVRCGDDDFLTKPELLAQAIALSDTIRAFPDRYSEESGGLLRAMIEADNEYELIAMARRMHEQVEMIPA